LWVIYIIQLISSFGYVFSIELIDGIQAERAAFQSKRGIKAYIFPVAVAIDLYQSPYHEYSLIQDITYGIYNGFLATTVEP
jgi:hypothetical protein